MTAKDIVRQGYFAAAAAVALTVQLLPYKMAVIAGGILGRAAYYLAGKARKDTEAHLRDAFPSMPDGDLRTIAREVFANQGKNIFELFSFPKLNREKFAHIVTIENKDAFHKAFAAGKGVLILSAHCANWEIMAAALAAEGVPLNVIARRIYIEGLNRMLVGFREQKGVKVILRSGRGSAREILRSLRHNESVGMLIDQDTDVQGVFVDFFGIKAWTPSGLAALALRTGAPVVAALDVRENNGRHTVKLAGPFELIRTGDQENDIIVNTQVFTRFIENHIRNNPAQWVWMHKRWKTQVQDNGVH